MRSPAYGNELDGVHYGEEIGFTGRKISPILITFTQPSEGFFAS